MKPKVVITILRWGDGGRLVPLQVAFGGTLAFGDCKDERRRLFEWVTFDSACVARGVLSIVNYTETAKFVTENERNLVW